MSGQVSFDTRHEGVVLIPRPAIVYLDKQATLYVVQDGHAQRRNVSPVLENSDSLEISNGVQAGDQVVVSGNEYLKNGDPVVKPGGWIGDEHERIDALWKVQASR
jgi:hypothetical protein